MEEYAKIINLDWVEDDMYYIYPNGNVYTVNENRLITTSINGNGYSYISLKTNDTINCSYKSISVHRLLASQFIIRTDEDIRMNRTFVHFKDFDKTNISISNLEWLNSFELNIKTFSRYNDDCDVRECLGLICRCLEHGYAPKQICNLLGLDSRSGRMIGRIYKRQIYSDMTKKYKF